MRQARRDVSRPFIARPLRDVVVPHPRILFVGINPSIRSGEVGHHFAGPGNPFWRLLDAAGITPEPLTAEQDQRLAEFGIALTNLCPRPTRSAAALSRRELDAGCSALMRKCERLTPQVVAFVGVSLYGIFFRWRARAEGRPPARPSPGPGEKPEILGSSRIFVVPNTSGLNASFPGFRDKLVWFEALRQYARRIESTSASTRQ